MLTSPDFKELLRLFGAHNVRYLIVGGYAVMKYTEPRFTKDLDLWIPEIQSMGLRWLALSGSLSRAIPEDFLKGLVDAGIEPILLLDRDPIRPVGCHVGPPCE